MEAQGCEGDIVVGCGLHIVDAAACGGRETEVLHDGGQRIRLVVPVGVVNGGVEVVVVTAPLGFLSIIQSVTAQTRAVNKISAKFCFFIEN